MYVKNFIFILLLFLATTVAKAQTYVYTYTDPCTGLSKSLNVPVNGVTVTYFGQTQTFQPVDFTNGNFNNWANSVYSSYGGNNPCGSILGVSTSVAIAQQTAINFISIINNISAISDIQQSMRGSTDILGGALNSTSNEKKEKKKDKDNNSVQNNTQTTNSQNTNNQPNAQMNGNQNNSQPSQNTTGTQPNGQNSSQSTTGNQANSGQVNTQNNSQNTSSQSTSNSQTNGGQVNNQSTNSQNTNNQTNNSQPTSQSSNSNQSNNQTGNSQPTNNKTNDNQSSNGNQNSGSSGGQSGSNTQNNNSTQSSGSGEKKTPDNTTNTDVAKDEKKTNILGGTLNSVQNASGKSEGGKPTVVLSSDFSGFNFKDGDVSLGGKGTAGFTSMNWNGTKTHGFLLDYTSIINGPNLTAFFGNIAKRRIDLISLTGTKSFTGRGSLYGTLAIGQMWSFPKVKSLKVIYLATASFGDIYQERFLGTALITGGMYDWRVSKRIDVKMMGLFIYAPYVSYYNDVLLKSPYVIMPIIGSNIAITKKFKFNMNFGGAYAINENVMNYTVMFGTRMAL